MLYGKFIDGIFKYAPTTYVSNDGNTVIPNFSTNNELMYEFGYKPITEITPENSDNLKLIKKYDEKENEIVITYIVDNTESYLNSIREEKIYKSKENLANYLAEHPLKSSIKGGIEKEYTITQEKQNQLTSVITSYLNSALPYMIAKQPVPEDIKIYWNSMSCICEEWTYEEISALKNEITIHVTPLVAIQQYLEVTLNGFNTQKEIKEFDINFTEENIKVWLTLIHK